MSNNWGLYNKQSSFVLGFHGCDLSVGESILKGKTTHLKPSRNKYDWLGNGIYFWESNPQRALDFAAEGKNGKVTKGTIKTPFNIGAIIDLGNCLNLINTSSLEEVKGAYELLRDLHDALDIPLPTNDQNKLLRYLDCDVIEMLHRYREEKGLPSYDSVRGVFWEGNNLYPDAGFSEKNHIQICIRNPNCIKGYFRPITT